MPGVTAVKQHTEQTDRCLAIDVHKNSLTVIKVPQLPKKATATHPHIDA